MNLTKFRNSARTSGPHLLLVGNPVAHSLSPLMHNTAAGFYGIDLKYYAVKVESSELGLLARYLNNNHLKGVNVTLPYKQKMLDYVDRLDATCRQIGALNTVVQKEGQLVGYNTDIVGFCKPLESYKSEIDGSRAMVYGTGGAARAVVVGLQEMGLDEIILVSRNPRKVNGDDWPGDIRIISYDAWPEYGNEATLFVNATPLGMAPNINYSPVNETEVSFLSGKICYDIVYKPLNTKFLQDAKGVNARTIGGLEMLIQQGSRSFELWTGRPFPLKKVRKVLKTSV